ncbi:MAG: hypothetical protein HFJ12_01650 [Bacilli bacterium]|nr:hypothetical protein [Bacilli bacterium]
MGSNKNKAVISKKPTKMCSLCNPQKYLKFNFSFFKENGKPASLNEFLQLFERIKFLSSKMYKIMVIEYQGDKKQFIEDIPVKEMKWRKDIPLDFREVHPAETNEKYSIFRLYPAGTPEGTANPRIIGMIKNTIFYIFYIDWKGNLYKHGR